MKQVVFALLMIFFLFSCAKKKEIPDKGVSFELNQQRKGNISDISYQLQLDIPEKKSDSITGKVTINFTLTSIKNDLVIDFNTDSSQVKKVSSKTEDIPFVHVNEHVVIEAKYLSAGKNEITIDFIAGDLSLNRNDDYLYTLFVPDRASTCFPLFDQPNLKASYELTLTTPAEWEAVANGAIKEKQTERGRSRYVFEKTKSFSSYLMAFAAGKFFKESKEIDGRNMTMYYRETDTAKVKKNLNEIFELHSKALSWLENYTSIKYPFDKFDFALIPSFQYGGMEHPGSIFYNESSMFLDEKASVNRKMGRASLIAHETAHMWFGDLVTMDWFNDVWMKEVFANFMAAKIVQPSFPEINHDLRFLLSHYPSAYEVDRTLGANPILQPLDNLKNAGTLYGAIIYQKAPIVMRHLERKIGEQMMRESLSDYLKKFSYRNATWDDLIYIIDMKSPEDIEHWSNVWVKTAGMPTYEFTNTGGITQQMDSVSNRIWQQPLRLARSSMKDTLLLMQSSDGLPFTKATDYNFPNADGFSYGYFKMEETSKRVFLNNPMQFENPVLRASMWINCWESLLHADGLSPLEMLQAIQHALPHEDNALIIDYLLGNLQTTWWSFLPDHQRSVLQNEIEKTLWSLVEATNDAGKKNSYFRAYRDIGRSEASLLMLESIWNGSKKVPDLALNEEDKITLAYELALKIPDRQKEILEKQLAEVKNPDRRQRMQFVMPALSNDVQVRDSFFESLKLETNREHEPWVLEALDYLHHPLHASTSINYLSTSLDLLQEIQLTGDIFFPQRWLQTSFRNYSSTDAVEIVDDFLKNHPDYPHYIRNKILQSVDLTKRAAAWKVKETRKVL